ncbi:hypothetical protein OSB04_019353 [Centaurea solstitialis]|uniref:Uncharacterized protein n=1 Tax=Centaurea solstitialis TaxID=347529 RepID=A0AA38SQ56_9ASTR|nr:hypothetical protein OSB04_019353 [Centaurea solstitialis]
METHKQLTADAEGEEVDVHHYRSMIGSLMYLTASRPDIMFAVCVCARYQVRPKEIHLQAVKRIFRYLKGQPRLGLWYPKDSSFDLVAYTDSDYGGANLDRKSTSGGCQFLGSRLVSWQCKKQTTVSQSTTEAEYIAASSCCSQVLWIQNQMIDYGLTFLQTPIYIDNNSAISIVNNPVKHSKTKHIEIRFHFIRDCNEKKLIQVLKVHTDNQFADLFTKAFDVGREQVNVLRDYHCYRLLPPLRFVKDHNKVGYLEKDCTSEGYEDIIDFLNESSIAHSIKLNPIIYVEHMKDFWRNASVQEEMEYHLILNDAQGMTMLDSSEIMNYLLQMGYAGHQDSMKYKKGKLCPQWRFFVHTLLHCFSKKSTCWDEFSSSMASALVCLSTNRVFNFSQFLFDNLVDNLVNIPKPKVKTFFLYPRFVQEVINRELTDVPCSGDTYKSGTLTSKVFSNKKRVADGSNQTFTPLFPTMMRVNPQRGEASGLQPTQSSIPTDERAKELLPPLTLHILKPKSPLVEHSPLEKSQRETLGVKPHSSIKKVLTTEMDEHAGGPWCQETKGADDAQARPETSVKHPKEPLKKGTPSTDGEGSFTHQELMAYFEAIAQDLKRHGEQIAELQKGGSDMGDKVNVVEEIIPMQHKLMKFTEHKVKLLEKTVRYQGTKIASQQVKIAALNKRYSTLLAFTKGEKSGKTQVQRKREVEFKGEKQPKVSMPEVVNASKIDTAEAKGEHEAMKETDLGVNEDEMSLAQLLKLPTKGVVIREPIDVKKKAVESDLKDKGKKKIVEEDKAGSKLVMDSVMENVLTEDLIKQLDQEDELKRKQELAKIAERDREEAEKLQQQFNKEDQVVVKKKPFKKISKKAVSKKASLPSGEERKRMVRFLADSLGRPVQFFSRWTLEEIKQKYDETRNEIHEQAQKAKEILAKREKEKKEREEKEKEKKEKEKEEKAKEADDKEMLTTEDNVDATAEREPVSTADVTKEDEKEEEQVMRSSEKEIEMQTPKSKRKKSIAKRKKVVHSEEVSDITMWVVFSERNMNVLKVIRTSGKSEVHPNVLNIFKRMSKADLKKMYEIGCAKEVEDFEDARLLVEYLKMMFAFSKTRAEIKEKRVFQIIGGGRVVEWNTYSNRVYVVNFEKGDVNYFLLDKWYDFDQTMVVSMLQVAEQKGDLSSLDKELIEKLKQLLSEKNEGLFKDKLFEQKIKKVVGWDVNSESMFVLKFDDESEVAEVDWVKVLEACSRENLKEMFELRQTVIDLAMQEETSTGQTVKVKEALECLYWLFKQVKGSEVNSDDCVVVTEWRWIESCRVFRLSLNSGEPEYYLEESDSDQFDVQRMQGMLNVGLITDGEPTKPARLLKKRIETYLKRRLRNLASHA